MDEQNQIDRMLLDYIDENRDQLVEHVRQMVREQGYEGVESINGYHPKNICRDHWEH